MPEVASAPMNFPTLMGVYLAVNSLADAYVLVDGPDCSFYKAHFIHGRHDQDSTLLRVNGRHRVSFTNVCSRGVVKEHDDIIRGHVETLDALPESGLVMVTALPMCSITGVDYGRVIRSAGSRLSKPALDIPPESLVGDWLDGYAETLTALSRSLALSRDARRKGVVAVVGHMMDRNEADNLANLAELRRMLAALGLETASVWLGGQKSAELRRVEEAELIVSLPYARAAARRLAGATGAALVETDLPFGLPKTIGFVRAVAQASGKTAEAEAFIDAELSRVVPRLKWTIPRQFLNRRAAFVGDPYLLGGFQDIASELGMTLEGAVVRARAAHAGPTGPRVFYEPPVFSDEVRSVMMTPVDLLVSSWCEHEWPRVASPVLEFGFPSYRHHALYERPFLGFNGFLSFVDRMAGELSRPGRDRGPRA